MPTYRKGDYWDEYDRSDLFLFTGCGVVINKCLVMGAGTARQVRDRYWGISKAIGRTIIDRGYPCIDNVYTYGLLVSDRYPKAKLGAFQTKLHWKNPSPIELIYESACLLQAWCYQNPTARVDLPMPGVGCGGLESTDILSITDILPNRVNVWER
jgi:hypothetical protein